MKKLSTLFFVMAAAVTMVATAPKATAQDVTIGGFTSSSGSIPTDCYYKNSVSQFIYTASELGGGCTINSITFRHSDHPQLGGGCTPLERTFHIYLTETTQSDYSGTNGWVTVSCGDLVSTSGVTMPNGPADITITLDAPFNYSGNANLAVTVVDNNDTYENQHYFLGDAPGSLRSIQTASDATTYSISALPADATTYNFRPRITFGTSVSPLEVEIVGATWQNTVSYYYNINSVAVYDTIGFAADGPDDASYAWDIEGATPTSATGATVDAVWSQAGTYTVTLTATRGDQTATASHEVTVVDWRGQWGDTLAYCNDEYIGAAPKSNDRIWGIRIPAMHLEGRATLREVQIYVVSDSYGDASGDYHLYVYQGSKPSQDNIVLDSVMTFNEGGWKNIALSGGMTLDPTEDLWIGFDYIGEHNYPCAVCHSSEDRNGGFSWPKSGNGRYYVSEHSGNIIATWMIRAVTQGNAGIGSVEPLRATVSPNPTAGVVRVESAEPVRRVEVMDLTGKRLLSADGGDVDLTTMAPGTYLLRIVTDSGTAVRRVVRR
ncbi:MAG: T9SS type A sorting domain-containing protein [Bacteroidales bacterium]|nr:T9SS type A sorting domain-containing protein [Bacteroidales bacterium]